MTAFTLTAPYPMTALKAAFESLTSRRRLIIGFAIGLPISFYTLLLTVLIIRYDALPNYITPYDWPANVWRIVVSTQSIADMLPITADEWLLEIGYKNYVYGYGVADWSLALIPHKLILLILTGAFVGLNLSLLTEPQNGSILRQTVVACIAGLFASGGAAAAGFTSVTLFAASHCSAPSWIGGLAILGFDSYDLYSIEPYGPVICTVGFALLAGSALLVSHNKVVSC